MITIIYVLQNINYLSYLSTYTFKETVLVEEKKYIFSEFTRYINLIIGAYYLYLVTTLNIKPIYHNTKETILLYL